MPHAEITPDELFKRVARFDQLTPSRRPLIDAVLPQFQREIFSIIGGGVLEDPANRPPITAVEGFHLSIVKCAPGMGTGLHDHKTVEVFMPLTGTWAVIWGDEGENELALGQYDVISVPINVMRGFRNDSDHEALLLAIVGGTDPGRVEWTDSVMSAVREKGFDLDAGGKIVELAKS